MPFRLLLQRPTALLAAASLLQSPAVALVRFNDGKDEIHVTATASVGYDSNIFTARSGGSDVVTTGSVGLEYRRRAGMIGVNGNIGFDLGRFDEFSEEDYQNPRYRVEFNKDSGRTTGALSLGAQRQSRADPAANVRTESWSYDGTLNFKYPVIDRYSISGNIGYGLQDYVDNRFLVDLQTYTLATDLFYVYTSERDLIGGYRLRVSETSADITFYDHAFTLGVSGKILAKLNGTLRVGYQIREARGGLAETYDSLTSTASTTWNINRRAALTGTLSKDFSTTSTNTSVDSFYGTLQLQLVTTARTTLGAGVGGGINEFLGPTGAGREDTYFSADANVQHSFSEHLKVNLAYAYYRNWSTIAFSDFVRHTLSLTVFLRF